MYCVLFVLGKENDNANADSNNVVFTLKDTKLYLSVATLIIKNQSKLLIKYIKNGQRKLNKLK